MKVLIGFITVTGLGIIELWLAIPAGIALQLHPLLIGSASALGAAIGAIVVIFFGERLRNWLLSKRKDKTGEEEEKQEDKKLINKIWDKYGVIGLGLLSPLLTGAPLGAAIGISLGASSKRLFTWMGVGIAIWAIILTAISVLGFAGLQML